MSDDTTELDTRIEPFDTEASAPHRFIAGQSGSGITHPVADEPGGGE